MDKLVLVFYVKTEPEEMFDTHQAVKHHIENLKKAYGNDIIYHTIISPDVKTGIECINPKLVSEEEYANATRQLKFIDKEFKKFVDSNNSTFDDLEKLAEDQEQSDAK